MKTTRLSLGTHSLVTFFLVVISSFVVAKEDRHDACIKVLSAGVYNEFLEEACGFNGGVKEKLKAMYDRGGCRTIVAQSEVNNIVKEVSDDSFGRFNKLGERKFCDGNRKSYDDLR
jgi:hypothetical protein